MAKFTNYSLEFDGTADYIDLGSPAALNLTGEMSFSGWINTGAVTGPLRFIAGQSNAGGSNFQWFIDINRASGKLSLGTLNAVILTSTTALSTDTWYHISFIRSGSTGNWDYIIYLNGVSDGSVSGSTVNPGTQEDTCIGRIGDLGNYYFEGNISDVAIWDGTVLNSTQINAIKDQGGTDTPGDLNTPSGAFPVPDFWWRCGEKGTFDGTDWTIPDQVGSDDGISVSMGITARVGDAPGGSINNGLSYNMDASDRVAP